MQTIERSGPPARLARLDFGIGWVSGALRRCAAGNVAVEFVLTVPILLLLMLGSAEMARFVLLYQKKAGFKAIHGNPESLDEPLQINYLALQGTSS